MALVGVVVAIGVMCAVCTVWQCFSCMGGGCGGFGGCCGFGWCDRTCWCVEFGGFGGCGGCLDFRMVWLVGFRLFYKRFTFLLLLCDSWPCLIVVACPLSGVDPSRHCDFLHMLSDTFVLASISRDYLMPGQGSLPAVGRSIIHIIRVVPGSTCPPRGN